MITVDGRSDIGLEGIRVGRIGASRVIIEKYCKGMFRIFRLIEFTPLERRFDPVGNVEFTGYCPKFDLVTEGEAIPDYNVTASALDHGLGVGVKVTVERA